MEDKVRADDVQIKTKRHPYDRANFLSKLFFCWQFPLFYKGLKRDITDDDIDAPLTHHTSKKVSDRLAKAWNNELKKEKPSLWRAIIRVYWKPVIWNSILAGFQELVIKMLQPILMGRLLAYYVPNQTTFTRDDAYQYAAAMIFLSFLNVIVGQRFAFGLQDTSLKIRVAHCSLIYRKALRLSQRAMGKASVGQMVNLMANDVNRFEMVLTFLPHIVLAPVASIIIVYIFYKTIDPSALVGITLLVVFVPIQLYMGKRTAFYRLRTATKTDSRVRLMNEIISAIQVIKMYTWEKPFAHLVEIARKLELKEIRAGTYIKALNFSFSMFLNRTCVFLCILTYVLTGNVLTAEYVYVVTSFYSSLRMTVTLYFPRSISFLAEVNVSVKRIQTFLLYEELEKEMETITDNGLEKKQIGVSMKNVSVKWNKDGNYNLQEVNFQINNNQLVALVGPVGGGKSTLLQTILKEVPITSGLLKINGRISYASQEPWLFVGSIRDNVLFGEVLDPKRYKKVVKVCALERDFNLFPYGDRTLVGEKGVTLSGGQKARINLARAVYKQADMYLLDDPLSAVDAKVGKQLYEECISGFLSNKSTVLVTHQLQYLTNCQQIYLLENGAITASGTYEELQNSGGEFVKLLHEKASDPEANENNPEEVELKRMKSSRSLQNMGEPKNQPEEVKEMRSTGKMSKYIYLRWIKFGGGYFSFIFLYFVFVLAQFAANGGDMFINVWVNLEEYRQNSTLNEMEDLNYTESPTTLSTITSMIKSTSFSDLLTTNVCLYISTAFTVGLVIMTVTRSLCFFFFALKASKIFHNEMFNKIVYTTMSFFNTNPSGRILNRFSKDIGALDEALPVAISDTLQISLSVAAIAIVICYLNPWNLIPTVGISILFYLYKMIFIATSRNLKRIEGTTRSPVFSHLTASLQGLSTIRAFHVEKAFEEDFDRLQDTNTGVYFMFIAANRTFSFWLDFTCGLYISVIIVSFFLLDDNATSGANVGLAISQAMGLTGMLQWGMRQWSELENQMTSVERIIEYTNLEKEPANSDQKAVKSWPETGMIEFIDVCMRYTSTDPYVLNNLTFKVAAGEKVGIVGRTGAGKSSLISALFRLAELEGRIMIDGVDTGKIALKSLRSKISIIPQEPVLFAGTMRKNLDPFEEYPDNALWQALEEVNLKEVVADLSAGLNCTVSEGGSNFSVGQRQLVCLARAVLRNNRILVLDEATANVDPQTDELIQNTIRKKFRDCTVLTIAHRLATVMDSDRILVMDAGHVAEFNSPFLLLERNEGILWSLVNETGAAAHDLYKIAKETYMNKVDQGDNLEDEIPNKLQHLI